MTRVLVTGAAGFIGSHLCESLLRRGCQVRGLDSFTTFYDPGRKRANLQMSLESPHFELIAADLLDVALEEVLEDVDVVAHLAGEPGVTTSWGRSFDRYLKRNVLATQRLLEAVCAGPLQRVVYASSSSIYGPRSEQGPGSGIDPSRTRGEPRPASPYGASKLAAEYLVAAYAQTRGAPAVSLRYFSVYGPRQRPDMAAHRFIEALLDGQPLTVYGDGSHVRDFTYVDDVVSATVSALWADVPPGSVFDIASERPTSVSSLIETLRDVAGVSEVLIRERGKRLGDVPRTEGRIDTTCRQLDWAPTTNLRTGLMNQVDWHVEQRRSKVPDTGLEVTDNPSLLPSAGGLR
ncbi:MAG: NAD-dependent epimerase/dehydratase family protein [Carbonactinosporaceae bacterium]